MKKLIVIRHAKSDWTNNTKDFDRPLSKRGYKDAPKMARLLMQQNIQIDQFVSSTANRAQTTCKLFAKEFGANDILLKDNLYMAAPQDFIHVISQLDDKYDTVAVFSHNNELTYFVNDLTDKDIDHVPTCGAVGFTIETDSWADFAKAKKEFLFFFYPKMLG